MHTEYIHHSHSEKSPRAHLEDLITAVIANDVDAAQIAIANGADPQGDCNNGETAMHYAAAAGQVEMMRYLHDNHGVPYDISIHDGADTPAHSAASLETKDEDKSVLVFKLLKSENVWLNPHNSDQVTPLMMAAIFRKKKIVRYMCENVALGELEDDMDYQVRTVLYAIEGLIDEDDDDLEIIGILHDAGFQLDEADSNGNTPLSVAERLGWKNLIEYIKDRLPKPAEGASLGTSPDNLIPPPQKRRKISNVKEGDTTSLDQPPEELNISSTDKAQPPNPQ